MIRRTAFLSMLLPAAFAINAQSPGWQWAHAAGGSASDRGTDVCSDASGNIYATGWFLSNGIAFGTDDLQNAQSNNTADSYLVKYSPTGEVSWVRHITGPGYQSAQAVAADDAGNVVVAGSFTTEVTLGTTTITAATADQEALFLARYTSAGDLQWVEQFGSGGSDIVRDIAIDPAGNVVVTGIFYGGSFVAGTGNHANASQAGTRSDLFLVKYDASGNYGWSLAAGGTENDNSWGVATDASGAIYVAGYYESASIAIGGQTLTNANDNYNDILIAKFDASGTGMWAIGGGTIYHERAYDVAVDADGALYVSGAFEDATFTLGGIELTNTTPADYYDAFLAKYDANGTLQWAHSGGGDRDDYPHALAADPTGGVVMAGSGDSPVTGFGTLQMNGSGSEDLFVVKYASDGDAVWMDHAGGSNGDHAASVAVDPAGGVVCTGYFNSDDAMAGSIGMGNATDNEIWVLKLGGTTSIAGPVAIMDIRLYPVPGAGQLFIECSGRMDEVVVYDASGRTMHTGTPRSDRMMLSLNEPGAYFARIKTAGGTVVRPFLIE